MLSLYKRHSLLVKIIKGLKKDEEKKTFFYTQSGQPGGKALPSRVISPIFSISLLGKEKFNIHKKEESKRDDRINFYQTLLSENLSLSKFN